MKNDYNEQFKDRLRALPFLAGLFAIVFLINTGLWTLDKVVVMYLFIAFVPIKFFAILFRGWQLWIREDKKIGLVLIFLLLLFSAFIFDFDIVPKLLVYGSGVETQGNATELIVTNIKKSHFVVYEFSVNNDIYKKQQLVSVSYFETVNPGAEVSVYYLQQNPNVSFLADLDYLKFGTMETLFLGFGVFASLYATEIKDKITLIINSGVRFRKPA
jgi:hypothetical protein